MTITQEDLDRLKSEDKSWKVLAEIPTDQLLDLLVNKSLVEKILTENEDFTYTEIEEIRKV